MRIWKDNVYTIKKTGAMQGQHGTFPVKILYEQSKSTKLKIIFLCDYFLNMALCPDLKVVYPVTLHIPLAA